MRRRDPLLGLRARLVLTRPSQTRAVTTPFLWLFRAELGQDHTEPPAPPAEGTTAEADGDTGSESTATIRARATPGGPGLLVPDEQGAAVFGPDACGGAQPASTEASRTLERRRCVAIAADAVASSPETTASTTARCSARAWRPMPRP